MATHNIKMRKKNGSAWDILYPLTLASNVTASNGQTVQHELDNIFNKTATPLANGAMSKEDKEKLNGIEVGANRYIHPDNANVRHVTDAQIAIWNDKYNRLEIDTKFNELHVGLDWKESVNSFADIATTYPNPIDGWTVNVKDADITYRFTGTSWIQISANSIPIVSQTVDGKMSKTDKRNLDTLVTKVADLEADMSSFSQGVSGDLSGVISRIGTVEGGLRTANQSISSLQTDKADTTHNHDSVYSKLTHTHNYAATNHDHGTDYLSINGGTLLGDLSVRKGSPAFTLMQGAGTVVGKIRSNDTGSLVISPGADKTIYLRPNGDASTSGEVIVNTSGVTINGKTISLDGHGTHIPDAETDISTPRFLRNDNSWQRINAALIGAAPDGHSHDYSSLTNRPTALEGQAYFFAGDGTSELKPTYTLYEANIVETATELSEAKQKTVSFAEIFNIWERFSHNTTTSQPANVAETQAWNYDSVNDRVVCTVNSATHIGFVSKDKYDNYIHQATLSSGDTDNDMIGIIIAFAKDSSGIEHTLTAVRNGSLESHINVSGKLTNQWAIVYDYCKSTAKIIASKAITGDAVASWSAFPNGVKLKIERNGDIIKSYTSALNSTAILSESELSVDLNSDPVLAIFKGSCQYGYSCMSQPNSTFKDIYFSGGLDNAIYDTLNGEAWSYNSGTWSKDTNKSIAKDVGIGRFAYNKYTKKMFYVKSASQVINISSSSDSSGSAGGISGITTISGITDGQYLYNNGGKLAGKAITASSIGAATSGHNHDTSYLGILAKAESAKVADGVSWANIAGKPSTYAPATHAHSEYLALTGKSESAKVADAVSWANITSKPSTFAPDIHSHSEYLLRDGGVMAGDITFSNTLSGIRWTMNTDGAAIFFKSDADNDTDSYLGFETRDNGNEYFKWQHLRSGVATPEEWMSLRSDGLRIKNNLVYHAGSSEMKLTNVGTVGQSTKQETTITPASIGFTDYVEGSPRSSTIGSHNGSLEFSSRAMYLYPGSAGVNISGDLTINSTKSGCVISPNGLDSIAYGAYSMGQSMPLGSIICMSVAQMSDKTTKEEIKYINNDEDELTSDDCYDFFLNEFKPVSFKYKKRLIDVPELGFIAQDVDKTKLSKYILRKKEDQPMTFSSYSFMSALAIAFQKTLQEVEDLKLEVAKLKES